MKVLRVWILYIFSSSSILFNIVFDFFVYELLNQSTRHFLIYNL